MFRPKTLAKIRGSFAPRGRGGARGGRGGQRGGRF